MSEAIVPTVSQSRQRRFAACVMIVASAAPIRAYLSLRPREVVAEAVNPNSSTWRGVAARMEGTWRDTEPPSFTKEYQYIIYCHCQHAK